MPGLGIIFYGREGIGKTPIAAKFPGPIKCLSLRETGFRTLQITGEIPSTPEFVDVQIETWQDFAEEIRMPHKGTLIIDSLTGWQQLLFDFVLSSEFKGDIFNYGNYANGERVYAPRIQTAIENQLAMHTFRGTNVILIGHAIPEETDNSQGADYMVAAIQMSKFIRGPLTKWADATIYMAQAVNIETATELNKAKQVVSGKARDSDNRLMYCQPSPTTQAKNRLGLPTIIPMGKNPTEAFNNFWNLVPGGFKK